MSLMMSLLGGRYRLQDRIAAGGMGEVWRGADLLLERPVAVKMLRHELVGQDGSLERFRTEARHAGALSHPCIVKIYDYCENDASCAPYLVMELVDGHCLTDLLTDGPMDPVTTLDVLSQAADGLRAAHQAGLVHRDVKPGNLLISRGGQVKITDFGIAHLTGAEPITSTGMLVGTPAYLAPERVTGASGGCAADLYALGIVAYECLTGHPPFTGGPLDVALAHREQPLPPLPAHIPAPVVALVARLTAKNPASRPESASEVARQARQLRDLLDPDGTLGRCWARPRRNAGAEPAELAAAGAAEVTVLPQNLALAGDRPLAWEGEYPGEPQYPCRGADLLARRQQVWRRPARRRWAAIAAVAVIFTAALAGWLLASVFGLMHKQHVLTPARAESSAQAARMVEINASALAGLPVRVARRQLRRTGLQVYVHWQHTGQHRPGSVLAVWPTGQVPEGSVIVLTGVLAPVPHDQSGPGGSADAGGTPRGGPGGAPGPGNGHGGPRPDPGRGKGHDTNHGGAQYATALARH
jgi:eukaryotic-like serine/threonine-protein kinase